MPPQKRMTANPLKPARYRAGKPAAPESESESEGSGSEQEEDEAPKKAPPRRTAPPPKFASAAGPGRIISRGDNAKINLKGVNVGADEEDEERRRAARAARIEAEKRAKEEGFVTEEEEEESEEESGSEEDGSEEESEEEEEEAPRRLMMRPKFIPKSQRQGNNNGGVKAEGDGEAKLSAPEGENEQAAAEEARRKAMDALVEEQIAKDLAARAAGKKHWDDDTDSENEVDDTDDVDPEAEYAAWKLRELKRLRREREAIEAKEKELAEIERRRNLTEEERRAEDEAHIAQQREEKEGRGKMAYMQKYFHKGAFYQDESKAAGLDKRDIIGARFADDVKNRELLPKALQLRDMTKLGKKGATKYRDLKTEDTGQWGRLDDGRPRRDFDRFADERFQPDDRRRDWDRGGDGGKGANAIPLGERRERPRGEDRYRERSYDRDRERNSDRYRDRDRDRRRDDDDRGSYRHQGGSRDMRRPRSRSRSPRRDRDDRRKRSPSRERNTDRYDSDKRRRVEAR
ncbi:Splicing factor, Prp19-binding domain-containing protein [Madurella fahalii]|uniref:Splicing factor, Prp19-binding domain-containing protein n=1 Tax=Madurella fahalii TaxID=1157608 RepID=A0ABQ0GA33_9PEZI